MLTEAIRSSVGQSYEHAEDQFRAIEEEVRSGLELKKGIRQESSYQRAAEAFVVQTSQAIWDMSQMHKIRIPTIRLLYPWGKPDPKPLKEGILFATAKLEGKTPVISYSPRFIMASISRLRGEPEDLFSPGKSMPGEVAAHEMWHLHQFKRFPRVASAHCQALKQTENPLSKWNKTRTERGARMAGSIYITACRE